MPTIDMDPEKVNALFQNGHLSPEIYNKIMGPTEPFSLMQDQQQPIQDIPLAPPPDMQMMPGSDGQSMAQDGFVRSAEETNNRQAQQQMLAKNQGMSVNDKKRALAKKAGISDDIINQRLGAPTTNDPNNPNNPIDPSAPKLLASARNQPTALGLTSDVQSASPYNTGYNKQIQGVKDEAKASGQKTDAQNADINNYLNQADAIEQDRQSNEIFRQGQIDLAAKELDNATNAASSMKVDPKKFWANSSTGDKVLMGVSLFLGAFGAANDGINRVVPIITGAIERDIAAQKANMADVREGVNQKSNALTQMRSVFKDERMAEEATKIAALEKVKMQVMQKAMQYSSPEVQAKAKILTGELETKKAEARQKFLNAAKNGGLGVLSPSEQLSRQKDIGERTVHGLGVVLDPRVAPLAREAKERFDNIRLLVQKQKEIADQYKGPYGALKGAFSIDDSNASKKYSAQIRQELNKLNGNGVMNGPDVEELNKMILEDSTSSTAINPTKQLDDFMGILTDKYRSKITSYGLTDPTIGSKIVSPHGRPRGK